jgi:hypothetical protein
MRPLDSRIIRLRRIRRSLRHDQNGTGIRSDTRRLGAKVQHKPGREKANNRPQAVYPKGRDWGPGGPAEVLNPYRPGTEKCNWEAAAAGGNTADLVSQRSLRHYQNGIRSDQGQCKRRSPETPPRAAIQTLYELSWPGAAVFGLGGQKHAEPPSISLLLKRFA